MPYNNRFFVFLTLAVILLMGRDVVSSAPLDNLRRPPQGTLSIISPSNNMRVNSPLIVQGRSTRGAQVEVSIKAVYAGGEQDLGTFKAHAQVGKWETTPIQLWLPEGARNARYQISAVEITRDKTSDPVTVTVLPPRNILFRPVPGGRGQTQQRTLRAPSITSPANNARVTSPLTIQGTSDKNAQIEINVKATYTGGEQDLGTFRASADNSGKWKTTPIGLWLPEGAKNAKYQISATQTVGGKKSGARTVTVLPPLTVRYLPGPILVPGVVTIPATPAPNITSPSNNARVNSPLTIQGTGTKSADVEINVKATYTGGEQDLGTFKARVGNNGQWKTTPIQLWLPEGARNAKYQISATQTVGGKKSAAKTVTVLPPGNVIAIPRATIDMLGPRIDIRDILQNITVPPAITSPSNNARVTSPLTIQGTSDKNAQIEINVKATYSGGEQDLGTFRASADNSGKWKTTPIGLWLPEGAKNAKYQISATQTVGGKKSAPRAVTVLPPLTVRYVPGPILAPGVVAVPTAPGRRDNSLSITSPAGDAKLGTKITVRGTGVPGANVDVTVRADYKHPVTKALPFDIIPGAKNLVANKIERKYPVKVATNGTWKTHEIDVFAGQDMRSIVDINYQISAVMTYKGADGKEQRKTAIIRGLKGPK